MATLFLALRYLRSHRIVYWSIAATAIGIAAVIVITSVMGGFSRDMRARIRGLQSDLVLQGSAGDLYLRDYDELSAALLKVPGVKACAPRIEVSGWVRPASSRLVVAATGGEKKMYTILGIDPAREGNHGRIKEFFANRGKRFDFTYDDPHPLTMTPIVIGREAVGRRALDDRGPPNDSDVLNWALTVTTVRDDGHPRLCERDVEIVGTFRSGMGEYDSSYLFMPLEEAQAWLKLDATEDRPAVVNRIAITLAPDQKLAEVRAAIVDALHSRRACRSPERHAAGTCGLMKVETWEESRRILLQAVSVEKALQMIILFMVIVVAGFNIISIYTLMVKAKTRDIGVVRALGATEQSVGRIFLACGLLCGVIGSAIGAAAGISIVVYMNSMESYLRVWTREMQGSTAAMWTAALGGAAGLFSLFIWWWRLADTWRPTKWIWAGLAGVLLAISAAAAFHWLGDYRPDARDPAFSSTTRTWAVALAVGLPLGATAFRRIAEAWQGLLGGGLFTFAAVMAGILSTLYAIVLSSVTALTAALHPPPGFQVFDRTIFYMGEIPHEFDVSRVVAAIVGTLVVCFLFSLHPASRAAAMSPVVAIRNE